MCERFTFYVFIYMNYPNYFNKKLVKIITKMSYRLHVVSSHIVPSSPKYSNDAHVQLALKFSRMFTNRGYHVIFYGIDGFQDQVICSKYISVLDFSEYKELQQITNDFQHPDIMLLPRTEKMIKIQDKILNKFFDEVKKHLLLNYEFGDIAVFTCSSLTKTFCGNDEILRMYCCNMGTHTLYVDYNVFVTDFWYSKFTCKNTDKNQANDVTLGPSKVIYPWFYPEDFKYNLQLPKVNHSTYLFLARCQKYKGIHIFLYLSTVRPQDQFLITGACYSYNEQKRELFISETEGIILGLNVTYFGCVSAVERADLLSKVTALIQPTTYEEPCGWNVIESMISACPVIATKSGGFLNTVKDGVTGILCDLPGNSTDHLINHEKWIRALDDVKLLSREECRKYALKKFSEKIAFRKYVSYFDQIVDEHMKRGYWKDFNMEHNKNKSRSLKQEKKELDYINRSKKYTFLNNVKR